MSKSDTQGLESGPTVDESDAEYTYHVEPPAQGGERYARCTDCGREILCCIGEGNLLHADGCRNA